MRFLKRVLQACVYPVPELTLTCAEHIIRALFKDTESPESEGYYFAPTLFDHVSADSALAQEEIFGPVLPMIRVKDAEQAFEVANGTRYGLAASLFTGNRHLVDKFVQLVESGMVHVNHGTASQAHVPFGGVKDRERSQSGPR